MRIGSLKAFDVAIRRVEAGEIDSLGASDHIAICAALRRYRDRADDASFAELTRRILAAEEAGAAARATNRVKLSAEIARRGREERGRRPF